MSRRAASRGAASGDSAARLLAAGAVLPAGTALPANAAADSLDARTYAHPALPGAPIVRPVPPALAPGEDLVMGFLGCAAPMVAAGVGISARRAPGFPGWALINDPQHARHALAVVKAMKAAARRAKSKPGHAWDDFAAIAKDLGRSVRHFLPSFWEECGRVFLAAGNVPYAGRCFGKAREAEQVHALKVDLAALREAFLEFALRGAVAVKELTAFARLLAAAHGAASAWTTLRELCLRHCSGGVAPWAGMPGDLADLAVRAGEEGSAALRALLIDLLPLPAVRRAPPGFWTAAEPGLAALAREPAWARALLDLVPRLDLDADGLATWIGRLHGWSLVDHLAAGRCPDGGAVDAATWLERVIARLPSARHRQPNLPDALFTLLKRLLPRLRACGRPLRLWSGSARAVIADPDLLGLALDGGASIADPDADGTVGFDLAAWAVAEDASHPARRRDPVALLAHPRWRRAMVTAAADALADAAFVALLPRMPALRAACEEWALAAIAATAGAGLPALSGLVATARERFTPAFLAAAPAVRDALAAITVAPSLARTLRGGVLDEFGWPALEESIARLRRDDPAKPRPWPWVLGQAPYALVTDGIRVEVVGPEGVVLRHDLHVPAGAELTNVHYRDRQVVTVTLNGMQRSIAWSTAAPLPVAPPSVVTSRVLHDAQVELPGGGTVAGRRIVRAGDPAPDLEAWSLDCDGRTFWRPVLVDGRRDLCEFDPATGEDGRRSLPTFFAEGVAGGGALDLDHSHLLPLGPHVDASPLGGRDGLAGVRVIIGTDAEGRAEMRVEGIDGRSWRGAPLPRATGLLRFPGGIDAVVVEPGLRELVHPLHHPAGWVLSDGGPAYARGQAIPLPTHFLHALRPRDAAGSAALRAFSDDLAAELLAAAVQERAARSPTTAAELLPLDGCPDDVGLPLTAERLRERCAAISHPRLRRGVLGVLLEAATIAHGLRAAVSAASDAVGDDETDRETDSAIIRMAALLDWQTAQIGQRSSLAAGLRRQAQALRATAGGPLTLGPAFVQWWHAVAALPETALRFTMTGDDRDRSTLLRFLDIWVECGLETLPGALRSGACAWSQAQPPWPTLGDGRSRRWSAVRQEGNVFIITAANDEDEADALEYAPDGVFRGLREAPFLDTTPVQPALPAAAWRAWRDGLRAHGAPVITADLVTRAATTLGCDRAVAALVLLGLPPTVYGLDKAVRDRLKLKVGDIAKAGQQLDLLEPERRSALMSALIGDDPACLWQLGEDGVGTATIARLAAAWRTGGADAPLPLVELSGHGFRPRDLVPLRRALAALAAGDRLARPRIALERSRGLFAPGYRLREPAEATATVPDLVRTAAWIARDLHLHQEVGSAAVLGFQPLPAGIADALRDPALEWALTKAAEESEEDWPQALALWESLRSAAETVLADNQHGRLLRRERGGLILAHGTDVVFVAVRPAALAADEVNQLRTVIPLDDETRYEDALENLATWRATPFQRLLARLASSPLPAGSFEANPLLSAPSVVAAVMKRLKVGEDAAAAYLQLLALATPTAERLARWNAWPPARVTAALDACVKAKLLIKAKRARAGRGHFLPGGWEDLKDPYTPMETWKLALYGGRFEKRRLVLPPAPLLPVEPLHELFARAWTRVESGDAPRYEEVP